MAAACILLITAVLSGVGLWLKPDLILRNLFRPYWFLPKRQYWTALSSGLFHADLAHLLFNGFTYWAFAFRLERIIGTPRFLALYLLGLLSSNVGTYFKHRGEPNYASLGASGAILAVLFASIVYQPQSSILILPLPVPIPAPLFAVCYLAYTFWAARHTRGQINHDAHFDGAIAGMVFVGITDPGAWQQAWSVLWR